MQYLGATLALSQEKKKVDYRRNVIEYGKFGLWSIGYTQGCALPLLNLSRFYLKGIVASERNPNTGNAYLEYHILESFWCVKILWFKLHDFGPSNCLYEFKWLY